MKLSRTILVTGALAVITIITSTYLLAIHSLFTVTTFTDFFIRLFVFRNYFVELIVIALVIFFALLSQKLWVRIVGYSIAGAYWIIYWIQLGAVVTSGALMSVLAFENVYYIRLVINPITIALTIACGLLLGFIIFSGERLSSPTPSRTTILRLGLCALIMSSILLAGNHVIPNRTRAKVTHYEEDSGLVTTPPVTLFIENIFERFFPTLGNYSLNYQNSTLITTAGFPYFPNQKYPTIHSTPTSHSTITSSIDKPNIILFFVEGFSAQTIGAYNSSFKDLTPNLDAFASQSLVVDHYYNHTAATYRGILGQLCSWYPYQEKSQAHYYCINNVLAAHGYTTLFGTSEEKDATRIDETTRAIGFNKVLTATDFSQDYLQGVSLDRGNALSDTQFGQALAQLTQDSTLKHPFFLTLYNLGTHAFIDTAPSEKKYGDGKNYSLNTIHNFDRAFGTFWNAFKKSPLAKNTIVIVTADHAHYPEKPYTTVVRDPNYQSLFIDQIPLILYDPHNQPRRIDAHDATSINITPTILDYLQIHELETPFIEHSLFNTHSQTLNIAAYDNNYYVIKEHRVYSARNPGPTTTLFPAVINYIKSLYHDELADTIWYH